MFTSYAQNFEDVMLWRALKHVENGFYIDVGAQHPAVDSVSLAFYEHGWRGVHIEPAPAYAALLREQRPDEVVIEAALDAEQGMLAFFEIKESGLSTADKDIAHHHQDAGFQVNQITVPRLTLDQVLSGLVGKEIHWLKIDVEGYERRVLEGWRSKVKPWVVVIESTLPLTQTDSHQDWEQLILGRGYEFAYLDGINRFFVSSEHLELLAAFRHGPNYFDDFALSAGTPFCANLNLRIQELSQRGQVLEAELRAREHQAMEASRSMAEREDELAQSRAQSLALRESLAAAQQHAAHVEAGLALSREQLQVRELEITQLHSQGDALRKNLATARQQGAHLEGEVAQSHQRALALEGSLAEARARLGLRNEELAASQARAHELESELNVAKGKADEQIQSSHHWWTVAVGLSDELQTTRGSRSWRLTAPLRASGLLAGKLGRLAGSALVSLIGLPRRVARRMLLLIVNFVQARQAFKAWVARWVARFPRLEAHLKAFVATRWRNPAALPPSVVQPAPVMSPDLPDEASADGIQWSAYSPSVRRIYTQLMRARAGAHADTVPDKASGHAG